MRTTTRYEAALKAAHEAAQWAGVTAYARHDGSHITVTEEHQNGEWIYNATRHVPGYEVGETWNDRVTFTRRQRATGQGLKQLVGRALKG